MMKLEHHHVAGPCTDSGKDQQWTVRPSRVRLLENMSFVQARGPTHGSLTIGEHVSLSRTDRVGVSSGSDGAQSRPGAPDVIQKEVHSATSVAFLATLSGSALIIRKQSDDFRTRTFYKTSWPGSFPKSQCRERK